MSKTILCVLFGGRSDEHIVSIMSCRSIIHHIDRSKYSLVLFGIDRKGSFHQITESQFELYTDQEMMTYLAEESPLRIAQVVESVENKIDVVLPILHGPYGEDGKLQGFFDILGIPYVGAGATSSALCMDKGYSKDIFEKHGFKTSAYKIVTNEDLNRKELFEELEEFFGYPMFIKPANLGSSVGINKASKRESLKEALREAFEYDTRVIVEKFVKGRELECGVLGNDKPIVGEVGEILASHEFYDFEAKYFDDGNSKMIIPAKISEEIRVELKNQAIRIYKIFGIKGLARVDFFYDTENEEILINEINTFPGFTEFSMYPLLLEAAGYSYGMLIDELIKYALEK